MILIIKNIYITLHTMIYQWSYVIGNLIGINRGQHVILCYHNIGYDNDPYTVSPEEFAQQIEKLSRSTKIVDLKTLIENKNSKENLVSLTFDDGYQGVITYALPILKAKKLTATAFVMSNPAKVDRTELDNDLPLMSTKELKQLLTHGWTIGSHSQTHTDFKTLNRKQLKNEIVQSRKDLEKSLGYTIKWFAPPKGIASRTITNLVKSAGYIGCLTIGIAPVSDRTDSYNLPRIIIDRSISTQEYPACLSKTSLWIRSFTDQLALGRLRWL